MHTASLTIIIGMFAMSLCAEDDSIANLNETTVDPSLQHADADVVLYFKFAALFVNENSSHTNRVKRGVWGEFAGSVGAGAIIGGMAGSVAPGVGTVAGAVGGGLTGGFMYLGTQIGGQIFKRKKRATTHNITDMECSLLGLAFRATDIDKSGTITVNEIRRNHNVTDHLLARKFSQVDGNSDGAWQSHEIHPCLSSGLPAKTRIKRKCERSCEYIVQTYLVRYIPQTNSLSAMHDD